MNNPKALVISFFRSNNIGDILISQTLSAELMNSGIDVLGFDYLTLSPISIGDNLRFSPVYHYNGKSKKNSFLKKILKGRETILSYYFKRERKSRLNVFLDVLKRVDFVVFSGGNMIMDVTRSWPYMLDDLCSLILKMQKKYYFLAVGVGPIYHKSSRRLYSRILQRSDYISVRDNSSNNISKELCNHDVDETIDPVLSCDLSISAPNAKKENCIMLGLVGLECFKNELDYNHYFKSVLNIIHKFEDNNRGFKLILFSTEINDYKTILDVYEKISRKNIVEVLRWQSIEELVKCYLSSCFIFSGRMHSLILAQRLGTPYGGYAWQQKVREFFKIVSFNTVVELDGLDSFDIVDFYFDKQAICTPENIHAVNSELRKNNCVSKFVKNIKIQEKE